MDTGPSVSGRTYDDWKTTPPEDPKPGVEVCPCGRLPVTVRGQCWACLRGCEDIVSARVVNAALRGSR